MAKKLQIEDRTAPTQSESKARELSGFGIAPADGGKGWVAFRCHSSGKVDMLTPAKQGVVSEAKHFALRRLKAALVREYASGRRLS